MTNSSAGDNPAKDPTSPTADPVSTGGVEESDPLPPFPPGMGRIYGFVLTNALSFNIALGAPIILFAKSLGASATVLGIIGSLAPLLTILQIPAARHIQTYGYKSFLLAGWGVRTIFIYCMAALPLLSFLDNATRVALLLLLLFLFNLLRGFSSGAWLPWITELIPERRRAAYLSADGILLHVGGFCSLLFAGIYLGRDATPLEFSVVIAFGATAATASLFCIHGIPEVAAREVSRRSAQEVPWKAIIFYPPFFRLTVFNLIFAIIAGSLGVFTISYLRVMAGFGDGLILALSSTGYLSAIVTYPIVRRVLELSDSRRILRFALVLMALLLALWTATAGGLWAPTPLLIIGINAAWGFASAHFNLANARLMMATMPEMGRTHFYAFFSVILSLGFGLSPILWGLVIDSLSSVAVPIGLFEINRYSIFFGLLVLICGAAVVYGRYLVERDGSRLDTAYHAVVIAGGLRRITRLWNR